MVRSASGDIVVIEALRRLETHVVVAGLVVLAETELSGRKERVRLLSLTERTLQHFYLLFL